MGAGLPNQRWQGADLGPDNEGMETSGQTFEKTFRFFAASADLGPDNEGMETMLKCFLAAAFGAVRRSRPR